MAIYRYGSCKAAPRFELGIKDLQCHRRAWPALVMPVLYGFRAILGELSIFLAMQFQASHIPADIDTYEKLGAWVCTVLNAHGYALDYNERPPSVVTGDSGIQSQFERNGPFVSHQKDNRLVFRCAFSLEEDYAGTAYTMEYQAVKEVLNVPVNVDFVAS